MRRLGPAPHSTACIASPSAPLSQFRSSLPSIFMCPMAGSILCEWFRADCVVRHRQVCEGRLAQTHDRASPRVQRQAEHLSRIYAAGRIVYSAICPDRYA